LILSRAEFMLRAVLFFRRAGIPPAEQVAAMTGLIIR
jgi:hypothetical protein